MSKILVEAAVDRVASRSLKHDDMDDGAPDFSEVASGRDIVSETKFAAVDDAILVAAPVWTVGLSTSAILLVKKDFSCDLDIGQQR